MAGEQKTAFIVDVLRNAQALANLMDNLEPHENEYFDNSYSTEIIQADLDAFDITVAEFQAYITMNQQAQNFFFNAVVTQGDYAATLNALRRAPGV